MLRSEIVQLGNKVHLEGTAYTAVLQSDKRVVGLRHYSALLVERGIDIHFADIIDNNGKANTFPVGKDAVQQGCFSATQITGD